MTGIVTKSDETETLTVIGETLRPLLTNEMGADVEVFDTTGDTGMGPPPHHHAWSETYVMIEGELELLVGDQPPVRLRAGMVAHAPGGATHGYQVKADGTRFLTILSSGNGPCLLPPDGRRGRLSAGSARRGAGGGGPRHRVPRLSATRRYVSPKRQAKAAATRRAILEAFATNCWSRAEIGCHRPTRPPLSAAPSARCTVISRPGRAASRPSPPCWRRSSTPSASPSRRALTNFPTTTGRSTAPRWTARTPRLSCRRPENDDRFDPAAGPIDWSPYGGWWPQSGLPPIAPTRPPPCCSPSQVGRSRCSCVTRPGLLRTASPTPWPTPWS